MGNFQNGQEVYHHGIGCKVKILEVHRSDKLQPFYTVSAPEGPPFSTTHQQMHNPLVFKLYQTIAHLDDAQLRSVAKFVDALKVVPTMQLASVIDFVGYVELKAKTENTEMDWSSLPSAQNPIDGASSFRPNQNSRKNRPDVAVTPAQDDSQAATPPITPPNAQSGPGHFANKAPPLSVVELRPNLPAHTGHLQNRNKEQPNKKAPPQYQQQPTYAVLPPTVSQSPLRTRDPPATRRLGDMGRVGVVDAGVQDNAPHLNSPTREVDEKHGPPHAVVGKDPQQHPSHRNKGNISRSDVPSNLTNQSSGGHSSTTSSTTSPLNETNNQSAARAQSQENVPQPSQHHMQGFSHHTPEQQRLFALLLHE